LRVFKITLAYDGTGFVGWQRQASGTSIQGLLEDALRELDARDVAVAGAGRTDAGVHALGQVASFSLAREIDAAVLVRALNARLPGTVRVWSARQMPGDFHARFAARAKAYRYRICNGPIVSPFERQYAWHVAGPLDVESMSAAALRLEGCHDFAAFQGTGTDVATTERTILKSRILVRGGEDTEGQSCLIIYEVAADGFLRHMVRNIAGTLVEIGRGRRAASSIDALLLARDRSRAGPTAPARGLFLVGVDYAGEQDLNGGPV
jgi:tRNA pseudouridine38-40 synthase